MRRRAMLKWMIALAALTFAGLLSLDAVASTADTGTGTGVTLSGSVVGDSGGTGIAGVEVRLVRLAKRDKTTAAGSTAARGGQSGRRDVVATTTTDAKGKFSFSNIEPGKYAIIGREKGVGHGRVLAPVDHEALTGLVITLQKGKAGAKGLKNAA